MTPTPEQIEAALRAEEEARKQQEATSSPLDGIGDGIAGSLDLASDAPGILSFVGDVASGIGDVVGGILGGIGDALGSL